MGVRNLLVRAAASYLQSVTGSGAWYPIVREPYTGAWQRNDEWTVDSVLAHPTVYACINLISSDIAKMRTKLVELRHAPDLWVETESAAFSPVLRRPNRYQTQAQFKKWWMISKLSHGNTYALLERDGRGVVVAMYLLDPARVKPLVAPDGGVFYELSSDNLAGISENVIVPADELAHDRIPLFHPLVGVSPLYAAGGPASVGLTVQRNSSAFFTNDSSPPGILTAPGQITQAVADEMVARWHARAPGKIAVLGNGLAYQPLRSSVVESQQIEHLNWTAESVAAAFRVPAFMVGAGPVPALQNTEVLTRLYYTTCLQEHVHDMESVLDAALGLETQKIEGRRLGIALHVQALLQMDTANQYNTLEKGVRGGFLTPNEARAEIDREPLEGGDTIYMQHQDYPMEKVFARTDLDEQPEPETPQLAAGDTPKALADGSDDPTRNWVDPLMRDAVEAELEAANV